MYYLKREESDPEKLRRWKCSSYQKTGCRARVSTINGEIRDSNMNHNHIADVAAIEAEEVVQKIHSNALSSWDAPSFVIGSNTGSCSRGMKGRLPRLSAMTCTIQNRCRKQRVEPPLPSHRKDIVLPPEYTVTDSGENFLLFNSSPVEKHILVFGMLNYDSWLLWLTFL